MLKFRNFYAAFLVCAGIATAYASNTESSRVTIGYTNQLNNGSYTRVSGVSSSHCTVPSSHPCYYSCPVDLGPVVTEAQLIAAGCTPSAVKAIYTP